MPNVAVAGLPRTRRGLLGAVNRLRGELGDANVVDVWTMGIGQVTSSGVLDSWTGAKGTVLSGTGTARPAVSSSGLVTFDGTDDFIRASGGVLTSVTGDHAVVMVGTMPSTLGAFAWELSNAATTNVSRLRADPGIASTTRYDVAASQVATTAHTAGVRVWHARKTGVAGGIRVGSGSETTSGAPAGPFTVNQFTVAADRTGLQFGAMALRAMVIYTGNYTQAQADAVNRFARDFLGASLS